MVGQPKCPLCWETVSSIMKPNEHLTIEHFPAYTPWECAKCHKRMGVRHACCDDSTPVVIEGYNTNADTDALLDRVHALMISPEESDLVTTTTIWKNTADGLNKGANATKAADEYAALPETCTLADDTLWLWDAADPNRAPPTLHNRLLIEEVAKELGINVDCSMMPNSDQVSVGRTSTSPPKTGISCKMCDKMTDTAKEMLSHVLEKEHMKEPFQCEPCEKKFFTFSAYTKHTNDMAKPELCSEKEFEIHDGQIQEIPVIVEEGQDNWMQLEMMLQWLKNEGLVVEDLTGTMFSVGVEGFDLLEDLREAVFDA